MAKGFQPGNNEGVSSRFTSTKQPKKHSGGRPPKVFNILKRKYGFQLSACDNFTTGQIKDLLLSLLSVDIRQTTALNLSLNIDIKEIAEKLRNGEQPETIKKDEVIAQVFVVLSQAICRETSKGESTTIRWIIEYLFGKAVQPIEGDMQVTNSNNMDLSVLTTEELLQFNSILEKMSQSRSKDADRYSFSNPESVKQKVKDYSPGK